MKTRKWIFFAFAFIILAVPAYIAFSSENILSEGKLYKFRLTGYDPFDIFRGDYLRLNYDLDNIPTDEKLKEGDEVYVSIKVDKEGFAYFAKAYRNPPENGDFLQSKVSNSGNGRLFFGRNSRSNQNKSEAKKSVSIEIPDNMSKYFINEDFAKKGEEVMMEHAEDMYIGLRVLDGQCRIQDIYIADMQLMEYLK